MSRHVQTFFKRCKQMCLEVCYKMRGYSIPESQSRKVQVAWGS